MFVEVSKKLVSILLAAGGSLDIVMRIANGWFTDKQMISAYNILTFSMLFSGITTLLCAIISGLAGEKFIYIVICTFS